VPAGTTSVLVNAFRDLYHTVLFVNKKDIYREPHAKSVDRGTSRDEQTFLFKQGLPYQQATKARAE